MRQPGKIKVSAQNPFCTKALIKRDAIELTLQQLQQELKGVYLEKALGYQIKLLSAKELQNPRAKNR